MVGDGLARETLVFVGAVAVAAEEVSDIRVIRDDPWHAAITDAHARSVSTPTVARFMLESKHDGGKSRRTSMSSGTARVVPSVRFELTLHGF